MQPEQSIIEQFTNTFQQIKSEISRVIVGHDQVIEQVLVALFADGHVLLEGVPGLGKTLLVKSLGEALGLKFRRIQFTPDLMPADVIGTNLVVDRGGGKEFEFQPGPIFSNIILADEINRATPKTQSAFLEAMAEKQITVAGKTYKLRPPFFVLATQNPVEMDGTYPLPEAQMDRFIFKLNLSYASFEGEKEILRRTTARESYKIKPVLTGEGWRTIEAMKSLVREVLVSSEVEEYVTRLVFATRPNGYNHITENQRVVIPQITKKYIKYGASTRGAQALILAGKTMALLDGRAHVSFEDIDAVLMSSLRHRIMLNFEAEVDGKHPDDLLEDITREVKTAK
jgi:MoxR-like ATPase